MTELTPAQERLIAAGWKYNDSGWFRDDAFDCRGLYEDDAIKIQQILDRWSARE